MEKQKEEYEKKALEAIQKATEDNSEAQSKLQNLQVSAAVEQACRIHVHIQTRQCEICLSAYHANITFPLGGTTGSPSRVSTVAEAV